VALARRIPRLSTTLKRGLLSFGVRPGSSRFRAVFAAVGSLSNAEALPGPGDFETDFPPGRAFVRRVPGQNLWILYRFEATHVDILTVKDVPPVPVDESE
jgi:hypothetical protein